MMLDTAQKQFLNELRKADFTSLNSLNELSNSLGSIIPENENLLAFVLEIIRHCGMEIHRLDGQYKSSQDIVKVLQGRIGDLQSHIEDLRSSRDDLRAQVEESRISLTDKSWDKKGKSRDLAGLDEHDPLAPFLRSMGSFPKVPKLPEFPVFPESSGLGSSFGGLPETSMVDAIRAEREKLNKLKQLLNTNPTSLSNPLGEGPSTSVPGYLHPSTSGDWPMKMPMSGEEVST